MDGSRKGIVVNIVYCINCDLTSVMTVIGQDIRLPPMQDKSYDPVCVLVSTVLWMCLLVVDSHNRWHGPRVPKAGLDCCTLHSLAHYWW